MRLHCFQHVEFEGIGQIHSWADRHSVSITTTRFFANDPLPKMDALDGLLVMGGPMGIYDHDSYPWLSPEKKFIQAAIQSQKTVIGICLGAQLIADALGAKVYPGAEKEIGWFPIQRAPNAPPLLPESTMAFHWHGDTFELPTGAVRLASSSVCENQGFLWGDRVLGLQFHLETTAASLEALLHHGADELVDAPHIQTPAMMREGLVHLPALHEILEGVLDALPFD